jgi:LmbE family N-acetylglucosaminyl deacetylase
MKLLAIGAHPDDIEIYMFGLLAAATARGTELAFAIATDGAAGGTGDPTALTKQRKAEATAAAALLDVVPRFLDFPDGSLVGDAALIASLKALLNETKPDLVITHAPNDYHGDHRALSDAVRIAASFSFPVLWADTMMGTGFLPTIYVDATAQFDLKREAIGKHLSQDPQRYIALAELWNRSRAAQCNALGGYAEAYRFEPTFPFGDIRELLPPAPNPRAVRDRGASG